MKKIRPFDLLIGLISIGLGLYFGNWLGAIGILPFLVRAVDWLHGLFTYRKFRLQ